MEIQVPHDNNYPPAGGLSSGKLNWAQYEAYVAGSLQRLLPGSKVSRNVKMLGLKTGRRRQVDVLVERNLGGLDFSIAVDCKCYRRKVNVNDVERFLGMLGDLRISKGVLMTTQGYTKTAFCRAQNESRDIELRILTVEQLSEFQGIGCAIPWNGPVAAVVSAPDSWVVDNEHRSLPGSVSPNAPQFTMYPLGHTRESALLSEAFIYGKIIPKGPEGDTIYAIADLHERKVLEKVPTATFTRLPPIAREARAGGETEKTLLRVGYIHSGYRGPEYSLYIDHPTGVLLLVLFCPEGKDETYVPILKWIGQKAIMLDCVDKRTPGSGGNVEPANGREQASVVSQEG